jgi:integrase
VTVFAVGEGRKRRWRAQHNRRSLGTFDTKREAERAVAEHLASRDRDPSRMTIGDFRLLWLSGKEPEVSPSTYAQYAKMTARFADRHGDRPIADWSPVDCAEWLTEFSSIGELKLMFQQAVNLDVIERNPWRTFKSKRHRRELPAGWLSLQDVNRLADAARQAGGRGGLGEVFRAMVLTAAWTGIRPGELFGLHPDDLKPNGDLHVQRAVNNKTGAVSLTKNGQDRMIVIPAPALDAIQAATNARAALWPLFDPKPLFPNNEGRVWRGPSWAYHWSTIRAKTDREGMDFYELRHFAATQLLEAGVAPQDVAHQLGHQDGGKLVISVYGHPDQRHARDRIRRAMADLAAAG